MGSLSVADGKSALGDSAFNVSSNGENSHHMVNGKSNPGEVNGTYVTNGFSVSVNSNRENSHHMINGKSRPGEVNGTYITNGFSNSHGNGSKSGETAPPPIAIVGMGMRLPGGVHDGSAFWDLLVNKNDGRCIVPKDRYNIDAFYSSSGKPGTVKTQHGYFLEDSDLQHLDVSFFSMNKAEVEKLDPQQRMLLEVVWECMENGGQVDWRGRNIGCYVGVFGEDWLDLAAKDPQNQGIYRITGSGDFALSNRVSYEYNLKGPRFVFHHFFLLLLCIQTNARQHDYSDRLFLLPDWLTRGLSGNLPWRMHFSYRRRDQSNHYPNYDGCDDRARCTIANRIL